MPAGRPVQSARMLCFRIDSAPPVRLGDRLMTDAGIKPGTPLDEADALAPSLCQARDAATETAASGAHPPDAGRRPDLDVMRAFVGGGVVVVHSARVFGVGTTWVVNHPAA